MAYYASDSSNPRLKYLTTITSQSTAYPPYGGYTPSVNVKSLDPENYMNYTVSDFVLVPNQYFIWWNAENSGCVYHGSNGFRMTYNNSTGVLTLFANFHREDRGVSQVYITVCGDVYVLSKN